MEILYFIGNGFDRNLNMATSYKDFYEYYKSIESPNQLIKEVKENISNCFDKTVSQDTINWSDLEIALGKYTVKLKTQEEFETVFEDIGDRLSDYLKTVEESYDYNTISKEKLLKFFKYPENSLLPFEENKINTFVSKWKNSKYVNVITLNYTKTLERILDSKGEGAISIGHDSYLQRIEHIHGYVDKRMILGVNDISQIANSSFHENQNILNALVKSNCNKSYRLLIEDQCKKMIENANLICLFGSSIGETDKIWWQLIGERLMKSDCRLIIFWKGTQLHDNRGYKSPSFEKEIKNDFISKTNIEEKDRDAILEKIVVGYNTNMFDIRIEKK